MDFNHDSEIDGFSSSRNRRQTMSALEMSDDELRMFVTVDRGKRHSMRGDRKMRASLSTSSSDMDIIPSMPVRRTAKPSESPLIPPTMSLLASRGVGIQAFTKTLSPRTDISSPKPAANDFSLLSPADLQNRLGLTPQSVDEKFGSPKLTTIFETPMSSRSRRSDLLNDSAFDEGYVTANEEPSSATAAGKLSLSRSMSIDPDSAEFDGFSLKGNRQWGASFRNQATPTTAKHMRIRSCSSVDGVGKSLPRPSRPPQAPSPQAVVAQQRIELDRQSEQLAQMQRRLAAKDAEINVLTEKVVMAKQRVHEVENRNFMAVEEIGTLQFLSAVQEQKVEQLEQAMSSDRLNHNEDSHNRARKHKAIVDKLGQDRREYEARANQMIQQLQDQMVLLQQMAMGRIETLEKELMEQRHRSDKVQAENEALKVAAWLESCKSPKEGDTPKQKKKGFSSKESSPPKWMVNGKKPVGKNSRRSSLFNPNASFESQASSSGTAVHDDAVDELDMEGMSFDVDENDDMAAFNTSPQPKHRASVEGDAWNV